MQDKTASSPFGATPFSQAAPPPFALTEPESAPQSLPPAASPFHAALAQPPPPAPAAAGSAPLKLSLATLLKGYSVSDLGFDPGMVPSWIMTSVPASVIQEQMASGHVQIELGLLIEGTTDVGFRNVLSGARRDLLIKLPANDLFHGLPAAAPQQPTAPAQQPPMSASQPLNPFAAAKAARSGPLMPPPTAVASGPIQPKPNANFSFTLPPAAPLPETQSHAPAQPKPMTAFDPFAAPTAPSWGGQTASAAFAQPQSSEGFGSDQLFGAQPPQPPAMPEPHAHVEPAPRTFAALPGIPPPPTPPSGSRFLTGTALQSTSPQPSFLPPPVLNPFSGPLRAEAPPAQMPPVFQPPAFPVQVPMPEAPPPPPAFQAPAPLPQTLPPSASSILGITPVVTGDAEQTMLRALLGVNENLTANRVVDLVSKIPGVAACSCVNGTSTVSHGGSSQTARDFQRQAGELARSIHALAPLIGISGAETFSINTNDRLMTFSFHPPIALGILHEENDLAAGLRDKITLVGRELSRMVAKTGGHLA